MAEIIVEMVPSVEMVRMVNSGTEATMSAIRLARGFTGREKIVKFEGCYHGHADSLLVSAGSGVATLGIPGSPGVPRDLAKHTLTLPFNHTEGLETAFERFGSEIAAVIVEPVPGNMGVIEPDLTFLKRLRQLTSERGALLIFDEVISGFRVAPGGAQALYGIMPDLTCLGKIIGGGLPVGAYGGKEGHHAPDGTGRRYLSGRDPFRQSACHGSRPGHPQGTEPKSGFTKNWTRRPGCFLRPSNRLQTRPAFP